MAFLGGDSEPKPLRPKRWQDLRTRTKRYMLLYGVKGDQSTHRPISCWIGQGVINDCLTSGQPLAQLLRKRMADRLRLLCGDTEFGFWINIERQRKSPTGIHMHGLLYLADPRFFALGTPERARLIHTLKHVTGEDASKPASNWVRITPRDLNIGWIDYCRKNRRNRRFWPPAGVVDERFGMRLEAGTHTMTAAATDFYERARIMTYALATEEFLEWSDADWRRVTGR